MIDETQPQNTAEIRQATQPQILNTRLRELYGLIKEKLNSRPYQIVLEEAAKVSREVVDSQRGLTSDQSRHLQQEIFEQEVKLKAVNEALDILREGLRMSVATPQYQEYILDNITHDDVMNYGDPNFAHILDLDFQPFTYGVGAPGATGIYALETALPLEISAFNDRKRVLRTMSRIPNPETSKPLQKLKAQLSLWESGIKQKYSSVTGIEVFKP